MRSLAFSMRIAHGVALIALWTLSPIVGQSQVTDSTQRAGDAVRLKKQLLAEHRAQEIEFKALKKAWQRTYKALDGFLAALPPPASAEEVLWRWYEASRLDRVNVAVQVKEIELGTAETLIKDDPIHACFFVDQNGRLIADLRRWIEEVKREFRNYEPRP